MKFTITKNFLPKLRSAFSLSEKSIGSLETLVRIVSDGTKLFFYSCDSNLGICSKLDATDAVEDSEEGNGFVYDRLMSFFQYCDEDELVGAQIEITEDKTTVKIRGKIALKLNNVSGNKERFMRCDEKFDDFTSIDIEDLDKTLGKAISYSDVNELGRYQLNSVYFRNQGKKLLIAATDGKRLFVNETPNESSDFKAIISSKVLRKLRSFFKGTTTIYVGNEFVVFVNNGLTIRSTVIQGSYPDVEQILNAKGERTARINVEGTVKAINKVSSVTSADGFGKINLNFEPNELKIDCDETQFGVSSQEIECKYAKPPIKIGFLVKYIREGLLTCDNSEVEMTFNENTPLLISDGNNQIMIMPAY